MSSAGAVTPVITNVATTTTTNSATVTWTTDLPSDTQIEYGPTVAYGSSTALNSTLVTSHSQTVSGLSVNQLYHFRVKSRDASGDLAMSANQQFMTYGASTDSSNSHTMNATRFTTATGGAVTALSVHVGAIDSSTSNRSFQLALYTANGNVPGNLIANTGSGTLVANAWNTLPVTAALTPGSSYFIAYNTNGRTDNVNNMHYSSGGTSGWSSSGQTFGSWPAGFGSFTPQAVTFSLYATFSSDTTPPTVAITSPTANATVGGSVIITADAADNQSLVGVQFKVDGANVGGVDTSAPYTATWETASLLDGPRILTAVATDAAGNSATSAPVTVSTNNPSKLALTSPTAGESIAGTSFTATYTRSGDWANGQHVHFRLDGGATKMDLNSDGDQSYTFIDVPGGAHTLEYIVADAGHVELPGSGGTVNFTTTAPDTTPPTVALTAPSDGSTVQNTVTASADAADETAVLGVQFLLDGNPLGSEDTTAPYSVSWNTTTASNGAHTLSARARDSLNQTTSTPVNVTVNNVDPRAVTGEWGPVMNWPLVAVHATQFYTGEILMWDAWTQPNTNAKLWNPTTNVWTNVPLAITSPDRELFCSGQATAATGELVVMGGHSSGSSLGTNTIFMFNPLTKAWTQRANMNFARWYPSVTQMPDNRMITFSGHITYKNFANTPEIFNPATNLVTQLPFTTPELAEIQYPQTTVLPSGKIMSISAEHGGVMVYDPAAPSWTNVGTTPRPYGVWTSFAPGKYLITGGGLNFGDYHDLADDPNVQPSRKFTRVLDMTSGAPVWSDGSDMNHPRSYHNVTMLPTGKALAIGGSTQLTDFARSSAATLTAEEWDPATNTWTEMAAPARPRMYHSISMLLPDGRVLSAGGGRLSPATDYPDAQIYSPAYLFQGPRPAITSAPSTVEHNSTMDFVSPNAADITKVTLSSLASVTHTADWNQRFMELSFTRNGDTLTINTPANANLAPENYYMIFLVNSAGVPSMAKIVKLGGAADTAAPVISNVQTANVASTSATVSWSTDEIADTQVEYGLTESYGSSTTLNPALVTNHSQNLTGLAPGTLYHYRVKSRDGAGNLAVSADQTFTTAVQTGWSLGFNGTNQYVTMPNNSSLTIPTNITLEAWIKPTRAATQRIAGKTNYELYTTAVSGKARITWRVNIGGTFRSVSTAAATDLVLNQWTHVAGVYNGSTIRLFINGGLVASSNRTGNINSTTSTFRIGALPSNSSHFQGLIDEVRLSNIARYSTSFTPSKEFTPDANTRGLWHFSSGAGTVATDASSSSNNGTLVNGPVWSADIP